MREPIADSYEETPLVSVVIIVKNGERYLAEAIESVRSQTYRRTEILVVDGGSDDRTRDIAASFEGVRLLSQRGHGTADAYNTGIDAARGAFVAFLSHDDLWTPTKLSVQVDMLLRHPEAQFSLAKARFFLADGVRHASGHRRELLEGEHVAPVMETLVARRAVFDTLGKLDPSYSPADDADWFARARDMSVPWVLAPEVLLSKRVHDANTTLDDIGRGNRLLLRILHTSIGRKRARQSGEFGE